MIIWFSLAVASLIFGGRVDGSPHVLHKYQEPLSFQTNFTQSPLVFVNSTSQVHYTISTKESIPALSVILCQTSAGAGGTIDSTNAFQIAQLFSSKFNIWEGFALSNPVYPATGRDESDL